MYMMFFGEERRRSEELWGNFMIHPEIINVFFSKTSQKKPSQTPKNENQPVAVAHPFGSRRFFPWFFPMGIPQVARKAIDRLSNDTLALQQRIMARKAGANSEALPDMSDSFLKLTASEETCKEVLEMYQKLGAESGEWVLIQTSVGVSLIFDMCWSFSYFKICSICVRLFPTLEMFELFSQVFFASPAAYDFNPQIWCLGSEVAIWRCRLCESWWHFRKVLSIYI